MTLRQYHASGHYYHHRGHRIFYTISGAGPTLLLLHGFPTSSWDWQPIVPALAQHYRLVMPDFIGFGFSDKPRRYPYSLLDQADLVEGLLHEIESDRFHLIAHDYGDTVAQELLARRAEGRGPAGMQSVVLLNGGIVPGEHRPRPLQRLLAGPFGRWVTYFINRRRFGRAFSAVFAPAHQPTSAELDDYWAAIQHNDGIRIYHRLIRYMHERRHYYDRWVGVLRRPPVPVLFINGLLDPVSGGHMVTVYERIAEAPQVVRLPAVGHYPQVEAPEMVVKAILQFLL